MVVGSLNMKPDEKNLTTAQRRIRIEALLWLVEEFQQLVRSLRSSSIPRRPLQAGAGAVTRVG